MLVISLDSLRGDSHGVGNIVQHYSYSSFGQLLKIENGGVDSTDNPAIKQPFTYTNREYDPELGGLYYYRARYYDSHAGRFMQEDPHAGSLSGPESFNNKYVYVGSNPVNNFDPTGEVTVRFNLGDFYRNVSRETTKAWDSTAKFLKSREAQVIYAAVGSYAMYALAGSAALVGSPVIIAAAAAMSIGFAAGAGYAYFNGKKDVFAFAAITAGYAGVTALGAGLGIKAGAALAGYVGATGLSASAITTGVGLIGGMIGTSLMDSISGNGEAKAVGAVSAAGGIGASGGFSGSGSAGGEAKGGHGGAVFIPN